MTRTPDTMTRRGRWGALALLSGGLLLVVMDMTILIMALPRLVEDLQSTATEQLWIVDIYGLTLAGLLIPMSALADRYGRRRILLLGFFLFGAISALVLVAEASLAVIVLRALLGVAGAMIMPTTLSMVRSVFQDPEERMRALAIWSLTAGIGAIVGPIVGGGLLEVFDWQAAFLINVPVCIVVIAAGVWLLPEVREPNPPRWDFLAIALSIAGMVALVWGVKELGKHGWVEPVDWAKLLVGAALMGLFVWRCLAQKEPLLDVRLFSSKPFTAGTLTAFATSFALGGILLLVAQWLQIVGGYSPLQAGMALLPLALGSLITTPLAPDVAKRIGARSTLVGGLVVSAVGLLLLALGQVTGYWQLVAPMVLVGGGMGSLAIASGIVMGSSPKAKAGNAAAIEESMYDLGEVFGVAILGSVAASVYRSRLGVEELALGSDRGAVEFAEESLVGALAVAQKYGLPEFAERATAAFNSGLTQAALAGGIGLMVVAALAFALMPRHVELSDEAHG
ncbi:MFS transporter [Corynebacterium sp.]|uniref:MFS transporter n=1 Tax=Corynebacterium sp. TaxID=1720 RepID=UPI0026DCC701|nr:MFS transporter [Corynebacterium sp.]MDO5077838.1 MFS transporter [Corynebacterium sp.]